MRCVPSLLVTTALSVALAFPASSQQIERYPVDRPAGSPAAVGGALLVLLMLGVAGFGSDSAPAGSTPDPDPGPGPEPDYAPPGGYNGDLRPRYVIGVEPFRRNLILGPGGDRKSFETPEYLEGWGLDAINAAARYAEGADGSGALVSVFDSGVDSDHPELRAAYDAGRSHSYFSGPMRVTDDHGTHVAAIIAGARDRKGMHGVAPGSRIMAFRALSGSESERSGPFYRNWEDAMLRSVEAGADVMNNSWTFIDQNGDPLRIGLLSNRQDAIAYFGSDLIGTIAYTAQQDLVSVYAAGNGGGGGSSITAGLPVVLEEIRDHWVSVVALNEDDTIAGYSSRCGAAAEWCLAAPGTGIVSAGLDKSYAEKSGSSMAAAFVSGSVALLKSNFPEITGATALRILKDTARDLGDPGVDPVFGHGAIDLETAVRPVGKMSVQMSSVLNDKTAPLDKSGISAPAGVSGPMRQALSATLMSATDAYDRSYLVPVGAMVADIGAPDVGADLSRFAIRGSAAGVPQGPGTFVTAGAPVRDSAAALPDDAGFAGGHAALVGDAAVGLSHSSDLGGGLSFGVSGAFASEAGTSSSRYAAASLSAEVGGSVFSLETGRIAESDGMLGARFFGAFGGVSSDTRYLRASADLSMGRNGTLHLTASSGETEATGSGLIRSGRIESESFGLGVSHRDEATGSALSFGVSRPLGISGGTIDMALPVGIAAASGGVSSDEVKVQNVSLDLEETRAPLDLQFGYEVPVGSGRLGLAVSQRVGSDEEAGMSASLGVSFRF